MSSSVLATVFVAALLQQPAPAAPIQAPAPKPATPAASSPSGQSGSAGSSARTGSVEVIASSGTGVRIADVKVMVEGPASRQGATAASGALLLVNLPAGTYRGRFERDGFITFEKEIVVRNGARTATEAVLTPAPPPPPPPPPPPAPVQTPVQPALPTLTAGAPTTASLSDLAEQMLKDRGNTVERLLGCSGASQSRLFLSRDVLVSPGNPDADEMTYIVAGEADLKIGDKTQPVSAGWFGLIPRGSAHTFTKKGRGPAVIVLSVVSGVPCPGR